MNFIKHVISIIELRESWEKESFDLSEKVISEGLDLNSFKLTTKEKYDKIFNTFCSSNVKSSGMAYSNEPELSISNIEISIIEEKKTSALIKVQPKDSSSYYIYTFKLIGEEWKINNIQLVAPLLGVKKSCAF